MVVTEGLTASLGKLFKSSAYSSLAQISLFSKRICRLKTYMTRFHRHLFLGLCGILKSSFPKEVLVLGFHLSPFLCLAFPSVRQENMASVPA